MKKINGKAFLIFVAWFLIVGLLVYSRFINLGWGLPYPMHPDERNMANALQQLSCGFSSVSRRINLQECFNPHFFAYGQLPLYLGYLLLWILRGFKNFGSLIINFEEAVMSLRVISAVASVLNAIIIINIIKVITNKTRIPNLLPVLLMIVFSPFFIQFSHFGTTESLLMLFYSIIIYLSIRLLKRRTTGPVVWLALVSGLAVAAKISSALFLTVPVIVLISHLRQDFGGQAKLSSTLKTLSSILGFVLCTLISALIFSPHNLINFRDFASSIRFESDVALGKISVFYTRQFFNTVPVWFQLTRIFPYVLGWPILILGGLGFLRLSWRDKKINLIRFAFLIYFIPSSIIYAKWTRFMAPVLPLILLFAILFLLRIKVVNVIKIIIIILAILPGIAYLSVYQNPDIRFQASEWINNNILENSFVISETANVVDIPLTYKKNINVISFNFYDLDESPELQSNLKNYIEKADYIFIPSRRIFANHPRNKYPLLNGYYDKLFSGELGFEKVAEFSTGLNDEQAEETWTVFDHPVIRIYKRI